MTRNDHVRKSRDAGAPLISAAHLACGSGWKINEYTCLSGPGDAPADERHDVVTIAAVVEGSFVYHGDSGRHLMHPGTLLAGNHGCCYACGHDHGAGDRCIALHVDYELFSEIASSFAGTARFRFPVAMLPASRAFAPFLAALAAFDPKMRDGAGSPGPSRLDRDAAIAVHLAGLMRGVSGSKSSPVRTTPLEERRIKAVLETVDAHLADEHTLDALAVTAGMSKFHFLRTFRKVTGTTPHNYILTRRLARAAQRIAVMDAPISEIAFDAGVPDLSSFNRQFRATFKATPTEYRASMKAAR